MTSSLTVTFSSATSVLQTKFLPEIMLDDNYDYSCALLDLIIKNIDLEKIADLGLIRIDCDIISGSYINGQRNHTIHQFAPGTLYVKGQTLLEVPKKVKNPRQVKQKQLESQSLLKASNQVESQISVEVSKPVESIILVENPNGSPQAGERSNISGNSETSELFSNQN